MLKTVLKRLLPAEVRLWRYSVGERIVYYPRLLTHLGNRFECPICRWTFREFLHGDKKGVPHYRNGQLVLEGQRLNVGCPRCDATDRERHVFLYITGETNLLQDGGRILHIAPDPNLRQLLEGNRRIQYVSGDLFEHGVSIRMDLTKLPHRDQTFAAIICNHVLEHVPNDRAAMCELYRVLKPGGWAILQVPMVDGLPATFEDPSITSAADRTRYYGQSDHVRLYGQDYPDRLRAAGFDVTCWSYAAQHGEAAAQRYGLLLDEKVFISSRTAG